MPSTTDPPAARGWLSELAIRFTSWAERWIPDAFIFALLATVIVVILGLTTGAPPASVVDAWGKGFWELIPFTLQMSLVIITGYVVASARPVYRLILWLAALPKGPKSAVVFVAVFAMVSS